MSHEGFALQYPSIGRVASLAVFFLAVLYAITTVLGFLSLKSPQDPIGVPFVSIMELLILLMAPLYVLGMAAVHAYASPDVKIYSLSALCFMVLQAGLTSTVHFVVLTVGHPIEATGLTWVPLFLSWKWPSVVYTVDFLAWDWFFALSMLLAAPVFKGGKLEITVRIVMIISGILSLAGLIGVPLVDMQVRNIGIIGYGVLAPVAFLLMSLVFGHAKHKNDLITPVAVELHQNRTKQESLSSR